MVGTGRHGRDLNPRPPRAWPTALCLTELPRKRAHRSDPRHVCPAGFEPASPRLPGTLPIELQTPPGASGNQPWFLALRELPGCLPRPGSPAEVFGCQRGVGRSRYAVRCVDSDPDRVVAPSPSVCDGGLSRSRTGVTLHALGERSGRLAVSRRDLTALNAPRSTQEERTGEHGAELVEGARLSRRPP